MLQEQALFLWDSIDGDGVYIRYIIVSHAQPSWVLVPLQLWAQYSQVGEIAKWRLWQFLKQNDEMISMLQIRVNGILDSNQFLHIGMQR